MSRGSSKLAGMVDADGVNKMTTYTDEYLEQAVFGERITPAYNHNGLRAEVFDNDAIALYVEDVFRVEITLDEWNAVNAAILEGMKNGKCDV